MKSIAVFGGTGMRFVIYAQIVVLLSLYYYCIVILGKTGSEVAYQALKSGYNVIVLARDPSKMLIPKGSGGDLAETPLTDPKLTVVSIL